MIYVTADLHGDIDRLKKLPCRLTRKDTLIVLGDFGFLWTGSKAEQRQLKWLGRRPYQLLFLDGAHENYSLLKNYPAESFAGGEAQTISGRLRRLLRGEIYTIEDKTLFCMGGGESTDLHDRTEGKTWWAAEMPSEAEMDAAARRLAESGNNVDYILTHCAPAKIRSFLKLGQEQEFESNPLESFLDKVAESTGYTHWYFGLYHRDVGVGPRMTAVYRKVIPICPKPAKKKLFSRG